MKSDFGASPLPIECRKSVIGSRSDFGVGPTPAQRRKSGFKIDFGTCPCKEGIMSSDSNLSEELEGHMDRRLEDSLTLMPDEAFALALQQQEIARFR